MASLLVEFLAKVMAACCILVLIFTAIFLVFFFSSRPELPNVTLVSLNVSRLNLTADHISGYLDMHFQVINPNSATHVSYSDVYCSVYSSVYCGKHCLASTMFPGFVQTAIDTTGTNFTVCLTQVTTARETSKELSPYSLEEFDVKLVTLRRGSSKSIRFSCNQVPVGLLFASGGHGKMIGPARRCQVT